MMIMIMMMKKVDFTSPCYKVPIVGVLVLRVNQYGMPANGFLYAFLIVPIMLLLFVLCPVSHFLLCFCFRNIKGIIIIIMILMILRLCDTF